MKVKYQVQFRRWGRWCDYEHRFEDESLINQVKVNALLVQPGCPLRVRKTTIEFIYEDGEEDEDATDYLFG